MLRNMLKGKIHRARVTGVRLDYEGSVTIDRALLAAADILPYEQVHVLNVNTGARFTTYAIEGIEGAGQIELNGAAARLASKGDIVIILAYCSMEDAEARTFKPHLVYVDRHNRITGARNAAVPIDSEVLNNMGPALALELGE
jgi:aspartate 1-decarboxylase